jgi:sulfate adenylyltransferase
MHGLIAPYGDHLVNLMANEQRAEELRQIGLTAPSIDLNKQQRADLEMLLTGGYSPLTGFMGKAEHDRVASEMRLADGTFWPLPIVLEIPESVASKLSPGQTVALRDGEGLMLAVLTIGEIWQPGDASQRCLSGKLEGLTRAIHHDYPGLRRSPLEMREEFNRRGWRRIIGFQVRAPLHRAQYAFALRASIGHEANLLIHPVVGDAEADDAEYFAFLRSCQAVMPRFPAATTQLALLPFHPRGDGPREWLLRAIVQRNFGCTHLVVGGEPETQGSQRRGADLAGNEMPAELADRVKEIGIELIPYPRMLYVEERAEFMAEHEVPPGARTSMLSRDEVNRRFLHGLKIPDWFSFPEVLDELRKAHPSRDQLGFTVFFTGLSGAGKSTLAKVLLIKLQEMGGRQVTLLDGDIVRKNLSSELGFSREHRDINVRRIGFVASEITKHRGIAICAPIAPYQATRRDVRHMIEAYGGFFEVHVATPLEVCEGRDRKGLYAKARAGIVKEFTGISDPYETPENPELTIDTTDISIDEAVQQILLKLQREGYLR